MTAQLRFPHTLERLLKMCERERERFLWRNRSIGRLQGREVGGASNMRTNPGRNGSL